MKNGTKEDDFFLKIDSESGKEHVMEEARVGDVYGLKIEKVSNKDNCQSIEFNLTKLTTNK